MDAEDASAKRCFAAVPLTVRSRMGSSEGDAAARARGITRHQGVTATPWITLPRICTTPASLTVTDNVRPER